MLQSLDRAFYRRLAITAAVLVVYRLGCHLPLPGLNGEQFARLFEPGGEAAARISILAFGVGPLFSALVIFEIARTLFPSLRSWELAATGNRTRLGLAVMLLALAVTAVQSIGYAAALEDVTHLVEQPGTWFRLSTVLTFVGATALVVVMARVVDRDGIGYDIWILFLVPILATVPERVYVMHDLISRNEYPLWALLLGLGVGIAAVAVLVTLLRARPGWPEVGPACLWPLLMAYTALAWLLIPIGLLVGGDVDSAVKLTEGGSAIRIIALVILVSGAVFLYARSVQLSGTPFPAGLTAPIALVLALIIVADDVLPYWLGVLMPLGGLQIVVVTVVATSILTDWNLLPREAEGADALEAAQSSGLNR